LHDKKSANERTRDTKIAWSVKEGCSDGQDFIRGKGEIESARYGRSSSRKDVEDGIVTSFRTKDGSSRGEQSTIGQEDRTTNISTDTRSLDNTSSSSHRLDILQRGVKGELAIRLGCRSQCLESRLEDGRMGRFVLLNDLELLDGDLRIGETGSCKIGLDELFQCCFVEPSFELLEDIRESCTRENELESQLMRQKKGKTH